MSGFVHPGATGLPLLIRDDQSGGGEFFANGDLFRGKLWDRIPADDYFLDAFFGCEWWPSRSSLMGGWDGVPENALLGEAQRWARPWTKAGCNGRLGFVGYTRDQYGTILPNCTVRCFRTSTDELVAKVTSDANGLYFATSPYSDAHYLTIHKAGTPDVAGASIDTLTPS